VTCGQGNKPRGPQNAGKPSDYQLFKNDSGSWRYLVGLKGQGPVIWKL
jgi:hypothetical protein